jgi:uncharacterized protein YqeY
VGSIEERIAQDMRAALKERRREELNALRLLRSDLLLASKELRRPLEEPDVLGVLQKAARKRQEALEAYRQGGRPDLAQVEENELTIIGRYLPEALSAEELDRMIEEVVEEVGAASLKDMGTVMKALMPRVKGRADGRQVNTMVRDLLSRRQA